VNSTYPIVLDLVLASNERERGEDDISSASEKQFIAGKSRIYILHMCFCVCVCVCVCCCGDGESWECNNNAGNVISDVVV